MTKALVSLKGIVKSYVRGKQCVQVLHGIDLEIREGEFPALMGPSGSGKTTLLNLIGGIDGADEMLWACMIGMVGAAFPAIRAARAPLAAAPRGV